MMHTFAVKECPALCNSRWVKHFIVDLRVFTQLKKKNKHTLQAFVPKKAEILCSQHGGKHTLRRLKVRAIYINALSFLVRVHA